jgi:hypothetical protein
MNTDLEAKTGYSQHSGESLKLRQRRKQREKSGAGIRLMTTGIRKVSVLPHSLFRLFTPVKMPLTRPSDTLSPSDGERDGVRGCDSIFMFWWRTKFMKTPVQTWNSLK